MLAIRMQRTGRKGRAEFRIIVQESRRTPTSGAIVAQLGHYNPHAKLTTLDKEKTGFYLEHGAQPSDSVVRLLQKEGIALPSWVKLTAAKSRTTRHPEKLRKNQPVTAAEAPEASSAIQDSEAVADLETVEPDAVNNSDQEVVASEPVTDDKTSAEPVATEEPTDAVADEPDDKKE